MKEKIKYYAEQLAPYKGVIYFFIALLTAHFLWGVLVDANLHGNEIVICGIDCTPQFYELSKIVTKAVYHFISLFPNTDTLQMDDTLIWFSDGKMNYRIIWGCTGIKQLYIFVAIMTLCPGPWKKKLWYIPLGGIILSAYNIVRISAIMFITKNHPENFEFWHEGITKYIYYGLMFLLWMIWEDKIRTKAPDQTETK